MKCLKRPFLRQKTFEKVLQKRCPRPGLCHVRETIYCTDGRNWPQRRREYFHSQFIDVVHKSTMGNKVSSPFPTFDVACAHLNPMEINHLKKNFKTLCRNGESITLNGFVQVSTVTLSLSHPQLSLDSQLSDALCFHMLNYVICNRTVK